MSTLTPFVFWAQNEETIFLKVDLKDVNKPKINLEEYKLEFEGQGVGARGSNNYAFQLNFYGGINVKKSAYNINDNRVCFTITKTEKNWWSRLLEKPQKPVWLKIDHDKFQSEEIEDEKADIIQDYPNLYEQLQKQELGYKKEDFRKVYLSFYNLSMYVGFMYVITVLCVSYLKDGIKSFSNCYSSVGSIMCFLSLIQILELMHSYFGYIKDGMFIPFIQIGGRLFVLIAMLEFEPRLQIMPVVFYLFMSWSCVEIIRYPYNMSLLLKK